MLYRVKDIIGGSIKAGDGEIGHIRDIFFDDHSWMVRYFIIQTGSWLNGQQVLLRPSALIPGTAPDYEFQTELTRTQVKDSPPLSSDLPVSRQYEDRLHTYYGWNPYWDQPSYNGFGIYAHPYIDGLGFYPYSNDSVEYRELREAKVRDAVNSDRHLRSFKEVEGYALEATDGKIGYIENAFIDSPCWRMSHLVIDTRKWLLGKHVVVDSGWVRRIDWFREQVSVGLSREQVKDSPLYNPASFLDERYQNSISNYYHRMMHPHMAKGVNDSQIEII